MVGFIGARGSCGLGLMLGYLTLCPQYSDRECVVMEVMVDVANKDNHVPRSSPKKWLQLNIKKLFLAFFRRFISLRIMLLMTTRPT